MNAVTTYDFTSFGTDVEEVKKLLREHAKHWCFQQERAPTTDRLHFQGRLSLKVKERLNGALQRFPGWHLSITANENRDNNFYVTKVDTRVQGPWQDTDVDIYIPRQLRDIQELRPWQQRVVDSRNEWDTRSINIIVDEKGNNGKTILCTYCGVHGYGRRVPFSNDFRDIMRMIMDTPTSKMYLFDIPRALKKDHLYQFYAGIEEIKNGYAFDDRYHFREKWFDCPTIWIFTNTKPERELLSSDRFKFWKIENNQLVIEEPARVIEEQPQVMAEFVAIMNDL